MEYVIAIFVGVWISAAGLMSFLRLRKDFKAVDDQKEETEETNQ